MTAEEVLSTNENPSKRSQANHIAAWLVEFLSSRGEVRKDVVMDAARKFNKEWSEANISQVFSRRLKNEGHSRTEGGGKNKITHWSLRKENTVLFDMTKPLMGSQEATI